MKNNDVNKLTEKEIKAILQEMWKTDIRSEKGKKMKCSSAWQMGYLTALKEVCNKLFP